MFILCNMDKTTYYAEDGWDNKAQSLILINVIMLCGWFFYYIAFSFAFSHADSRIRATMMRIVELCLLEYNNCIIMYNRYCHTHQSHQPQPPMLLVCICWDTCRAYMPANSTYLLEPISFSLFSAFNKHLFIYLFSSFFSLLLYFLIYFIFILWQSNDKDTQNDVNKQINEI